MLETGRTANQRPSEMSRSREMIAESQRESCEQLFLGFYIKTSYTCYIISTVLGVESAEAIAL